MLLRPLQACKKNILRPVQACKNIICKGCTDLVIGLQLILVIGLQLILTPIESNNLPDGRTLTRTIASSSAPRSRPGVRTRSHSCDPFTGHAHSCMRFMDEFTLAMNSEFTVKDDTSSIGDTIEGDDEGGAGPL